MSRHRPIPSHLRAFEAELRSRKPALADLLVEAIAQILPLERAAVDEDRVVRIAREGKALEVSARSRDEVLVALERARRDGPLGQIRKALRDRAELGAYWLVVTEGAPYDGAPSPEGTPRVWVRAAAVQVRPP